MLQSSSKQKAKQTEIMPEIIKFNSHSEEETAKLATEIAKSAKPGTLFSLHGALGAGKSVFSRGFARGCGIKGPIPSPTFTIVQEYDVPSEVGLPFEVLYHMDLYRISDSDAALSFGIDEYLDDPDAVSLIEWPERIYDILPDNTVRVTITHKGEGHRVIEVQTP